MSISDDKELRIDEQAYEQLHEQLERDHWGEWVILEDALLRKMRDALHHARQAVKRTGG